MSATDNPFRAGMALPPPVIAGREPYLGEIKTLMDNARRTGDAARTRVFIGPRGVGKTVLLNAWRDRARDRGWIATRLAADHNPDRSVLATLVANYQDLIQQLGRRGRPNTKTLTATLDLSLGPLNATITRPSQSIDPATVDQTIRRLGAAAAKARSGIYLALDDLQAAALDELSTIAKMIQTATTERLPVVVAGAGLPELRDRAPHDTSITFTERVTWTTIGALSPADTAQALLEPFRQGGWKLEPDAAQHIVELSEGYPYLVQMLGSCAWDLAAGTRHLTVGDVNEASQRALDELDDGMYRIRWNRCSPTERAYLGAMARIIRDTQREEVTGREVADRVGREPKQLSAIRQRLIDKHVIESVDSVHATIRFTLPLYDRYVLQRAEPSARTQRSRWIKPPRPGLDL